MLPASAGASWRQPDTGAVPVDRVSTNSAVYPSIANIGGVPYVAWAENDGTNYEIRVARFNSSTGAWEQPWEGVSDADGGINQSHTKDANHPTIASVGGVPYVAWEEDD